MKLIAFLRGAAAILLAAASVSAHAWPDRPITLIQGFNAGGNADTIARIIADGLALELGQPVVVEARTGAGGNIASAQVARAAADGHTLILLTGGHAVSAAIYEKQPFDALRDFSWIGTVTTFPFVIATRADGPIQSLPDLLAKARANPGQVSFSSVGVGSTQHLSGELLQAMAGVRLNHIPYRGGAAPLQDVLGGQVDLLFDSVTVAKAQAQVGRLRVLGVTSREPNPQLPDAAPVAQTVPGYEVISWTGLAGPAGLPAPIAARLGTALKKALARPDLRQRLEATGGQPAAPQTPTEMRRFVDSQIAKWTQVVRDAGIARQ